MTLYTLPSGSDPRRLAPMFAPLAFGGPSLPPAPAPQPAPVKTDPAIEEAARAQQLAAAQAAGRASTIATSGQGDTSVPMIGKRTLLGA